MGTPNFAVCCLQSLIESKHEIVGVFTQSDKKSGRGHKMTAPPVKELALQHNLPIFQPTTLKGEETVQMVRELSPDLIIVVAYGKLLPASILEIPPLGCINVHGSLLPLYRGAAPIQWSVLNGETVTGVTTMYMAKGIDTGDMLLKSQVEIGENETASELYDRLATVGADLLMETVTQLEAGTITRIPQNDSQATFAPMLTKEMSAIDFSKTASEIHHQICGLSEWPCATMTFQGKRLKVYRSEVVKSTELSNSKDFIIACGGNTAIRLVEVQPDNGKRMLATAFLAGIRN